MAIKYNVWDKTTDLFPLVGGKLTPADVFEKWGWTENPDAVVLIINQGGVLSGIDNLEILKSNYGVTADDVAQAIAEIEAIVNAPAIDEPSIEERKVAAQEYQNLLTLEG